MTSETKTYLITLLEAAGHTVNRRHSLGRIKRQAVKAGLLTTADAESTDVTTTTTTTTTTAGEQGPAGSQGPAGAAGSDGTDGADGTDGTSVNGVSSTDNNDGTYDITFTKSDGTTVTMTTPDLSGVDGKTVLNGSGSPASNIGVTGDFYIDTAASTIYGPKLNSVWGSATSLIGPQGPTGGSGSGGSQIDVGPLVVTSTQDSIVVFGALIA